MKACLADCLNDALFEHQLLARLLQQLLELARRHGLAVHERNRHCSGRCHLKLEAARAREGPHLLKDFLMLVLERLDRLQPPAPIALALKGLRNLAARLLDEGRHRPLQAPPLTGRERRTQRFAGLLEVEQEDDVARRWLTARVLAQPDLDRLALARACGARREHVVPQLGDPDRKVE